MIRVVYTSRAVRSMTNEELEELLETCRQNNAKLGVTGMLLYLDRVFMQVLEGEDDVVDELMKVIGKDPRHKDVTLLERSHIEKRQFSNWSMGFRKVGHEDAEKIGGLADLVNVEGGMDQLMANKQLVASLLQRFRDEQLETIHHEELPTEHEDTLIRYCHLAIRGAVRVLAVFMVLLIFWGVGDVVYVLYHKLMSPPFMILKIEDLLASFGAFLAVLIAIEIFINITLYIRKDVIPVNLVVATALMAIARKVIIFDFKSLDASYVYASSTVIVALGITYWLIEKKKN